MKLEREERRPKNYILMRSMLDFAMGVLYLGVGLFMIFPEKLGFAMDSFDRTFRFIFGGICVVYGIWRIYRGLRKDY